MWPYTACAPAVDHEESMRRQRRSIIDPSMARLLLNELRRHGRNALCAGAAVLASCGGGSGDGLDANGRPFVPGGGSGGALTANFQSIQDNVFTPICTVCHAGGAAPQGLRLDASNSYALLVGVPSTEASSVLRIAPGRPDDSYLIQKLEGHAAVGARMPFGGPYLDAQTIATIRQWVSAGATRTASAAAPLRLALAAPGKPALPWPLGVSQ